MSFFLINKRPILIDVCPPQPLRIARATRVVGVTRQQREHSLLDVGPSSQESGGSGQSGRVEEHFNKISYLLFSIKIDNRLNIV